MLRNILKFMQALGIAVTGVGLMLGITRNSMGQEYAYAFFGCIVFYIARFVEKRLPQ